MKTKFFTGLMIRIMILGIIGMMGTFIPEFFREFFGDTIHVHDYDDRGYCQSFGSFSHNRSTQWDWGVRHYWYYWTVFAMFLLSIVNVVVWVVNKVNKVNKVNDDI